MVMNLLLRVNMDVFLILCTMLCLLGPSGADVPKRLFGWEECSENSWPCKAKTSKLVEVGIGHDFDNKENKSSPYIVYVGKLTRQGVQSFSAKLRSKELNRTLETEFQNAWIWEYGNKTVRVMRTRFEVLKCDKENTCNWQWKFVNDSKSWEELKKECIPVTKKPNNKYAYVARLQNFPFIGNTVVGQLDFELKMFSYPGLKDTQGKKRSKNGNLDEPPLEADELVTKEIHFTLGLYINKVQILTVKNATN